jgi:hypothetical protein
VEEEMSEDDPTKEAIRLTLQLPTILLTACTESRDLGDSSSFITLNQRREDPARPCDPLATVAYESWMFHKSSDAALNHWQNLPSDVIRFAVVEDAILHARSLCEIFLCSGQEDTISLKRLFADIDTNIQKYKRLREEQKALRRECCQNNGRSYNYEELFNTRIFHPTILRGHYGLYHEPLSRLRPQLLAMVDEMARLNPSFERLLRAQASRREVEP